jgi:hypothetical protein
MPGEHIQVEAAVHNLNVTITSINPQQLSRSGLSFSNFPVSQHNEGFRHNFRRREFAVSHIEPSLLTN